MSEMLNDLRELGTFVLVLGEACLGGTIAGTCFWLYGQAIQRILGCLCGACQ